MSAPATANPYQTRALGISVTGRLAALHDEIAGGLAEAGFDDIGAKALCRTPMMAVSLHPAGRYLASPSRSATPPTP